MSNDSNGNKSKVNVWAVGLGGLGLNGLILIINLVASSGYVARMDYEKHIQEFNQYKLQIQSEISHGREDQIQKLGEIAGGIKELNSKMQDNVRRDAAIADHETRIRELNDKLRK